MRGRTIGTMGQFFGGLSSGLASTPPTPPVTEVSGGGGQRPRRRGRRRRPFPILFEDEIQQDDNEILIFLDEEL